MENEEKWRVNKLEETQSDHDERIRDLEGFREATVQQLKTIFERLRAIENSNKWVSQSFFYILLSGVVSAVFALINWLITG